MKKLIPLILLLILISCGARSKYKYFEEQAILDKFNPILQEALKVGEERRSKIDEDAKQQASEIYSQTDSKDLVGSNPGHRDPKISGEAYADNLYEKVKNDALTTTNKYGNMQPFTYNGDDVNFNLYSNDPAFEILGFSPYRNNAELYRDYYKNRKDSWTTLWGLFN